MALTIKLDNVSKKYDNFVALKNMDLKIHSGEIFAYMGPNGAGKTTTINLILGLLNPSSGILRVLGENPYLDTDEVYEVKNQVGFLLDQDSLNPKLSGFKNILYWAELYDIVSQNIVERVNEVIEIVNLTEWKDVLVKKYSHGMKKRLLFARGIVHNPQILILDEPTNGIDLESKVLMRNLIKKFADENKTVFFSSHDLEEVQKVCTNLAIINKGEKIFDGTLNELKDKHPDYTFEDIYLKLTSDTKI
ncbi:MAG: Pseudogene of multidrug ABC transporter, ATPase component [Methanobrevibacter sp. CfCl-M3]